MQFQSLHHLQLAPSPPPLVLRWSRRTDYSSIGFCSPLRPTPVPANSVGFPRDCRSWPRISLTSPRRLTALTPPRASSSSASFAGLHPKKPKFRKQHRGRMKGTSSRGDHVCFGKYGLQALEPAWITARQIEAGRRAMTRNIRRGGKIVIRIFPDKPVTRKPAGTRMGSGKGNPEFWVAVVKPGRIIFEMSGVSEGAARRAIAVAASKMPIRTKFVTSGSG